LAPTRRAATSIIYGLRISVGCGGVIAFTLPRQHAAGSSAGA
jgi:hypothetical protein